MDMQLHRSKNYWVVCPLNVVTIKFVRLRWYLNVPRTVIKWRVDIGNVEWIDEVVNVWCHSNLKYLSTILGSILLGTLLDNAALINTMSSVIML